jgi:hypothetical protein
MSHLEIANSYSKCRKHSRQKEHDSDGHGVMRRSLEPAVKQVFTDFGFFFCMREMYKKIYSNEKEKVLAHFIFHTLLLMLESLRVQ